MFRTSGAVGIPLMEARVLRSESSAWHRCQGYAWPFGEARGRSLADESTAAALDAQHMASMSKVRQWPPRRRRTLGWEPNLRLSAPLKLETRAKPLLHALLQKRLVELAAAAALPFHYAAEQPRGQHCQEQRDELCGAPRLVPLQPAVGQRRSVGQGCRGLAGSRWARAPPEPAGAAQPNPGLALPLRHALPRPQAARLHPLAMADRKTAALLI
mmetsp:Transcript_59390/g.167324  ORF Transcript_59390/g.167324 Transcript_59390/m.167324 type:complete len:214 (-) Transcript_59390:94-735(-)